MPGSPAERIAKLAQRGVLYEMSVGSRPPYTREFILQGNRPPSTARSSTARSTSPQWTDPRGLTVTSRADPRTESTFFDLPTGETP